MKYLSIFALYLMLNSLYAKEEKLYLNYYPIDINSVCYSNIGKEIEFFKRIKKISGNEKVANNIKVKDDFNAPKDNPPKGEQYSYKRASSFSIDSTDEISAQAKKYIVMRLAGISEILALEMSTNVGSLKWGIYTINFSLLKKLDFNRSNAFIKHMMNPDSTSFDENKIYYIEDGDVVRILHLNKENSEVIWESAVDRRNFTSDYFNEFIVSFWQGDYDKLKENYAVLKLDEDLFKDSGIDWINPLQITRVMDLLPVWATP